ncbi:hypothetical protein HDU87_001218 [Geranomyces variabilis]|uniref:Uncharacterized protein n=1 Tax=Geranomyces variabilis TaxID=109894 RepID=A0AAD5TDS7_9FUNG|nr:hypothetical protein HDU87_001218 [Geranomyces variabilis]
MSESVRECPGVPALVASFAIDRVLARIASRLGQSGRCDNYNLEGKELEFDNHRLKARNWTMTKTKEFNSIEEYLDKHPEASWPTFCSDISARIEAVRKWSKKTTRQEKVRDTELGRLRALTHTSVYVDFEKIKQERKDNQSDVFKFLGGRATESKILDDLLSSKRKRVEEEEEGSGSMSAGVQTPAKTGVVEIPQFIQSPQVFGFVDSRSPSPVSVFSIPEVDTVPKSRLDASIEVLKGRSWKYGEVDLALEMRRLQQGIRNTLESQPIPVKATAEYLITQSCFLLTRAKPAAYRSISPAKWARLWEVAEARQLVVSAEVEAWGRREASRMLAAKVASQAYQPIVSENVSLPQSKQALALQMLQHFLQLTKPEKMNEATWCASFITPYLCLSGPDITWTIDSTTAYGIKRPDYHFKEQSKNVGVSTWEVKTPWASETSKAEDIARVISHGAHQMKEDLRAFVPGGTPVKLCIAFSGVEAMLFELTLHAGVYLAAEIGTWIIPTALQSNQDARFGASFATAVAIMERMQWIKRQTRRYQPRSVGAPRSAHLPPQTPKK